MKKGTLGAINLKLLVVIAVTISLAALPGPLSGYLPFLPSVQLARASVPTASPQPWYPAGPAMNTELVNIFGAGTLELSALCSGAIDLTDFPIPTGSSPMQGTCPNAVATSAVPSNDYFEIEFNLANNFWGVSFQFGNNLSGVQLRQGLAHLVDKQKFINTDAGLLGNAFAIDNPVSPSNTELPGANPCGWDASFPQSGSNCIVGAPGGTAYHVSPASGLCGTETSQTACQFSWMPGFASSDLCAAAQHFINAGLATGEDSNCVLTGLRTTAITAHPVSISMRLDTPRHDLGTGLAEEVCALFTGAYTVGCTTTSGAGCSNIPTETSFPPNAIFCTSSGPGTSFPGFTTCTAVPPATTCTPLDNWWMYPGGFNGASPFDLSLYFGYNSLFVSAPGPPCASTTTPSAGNYMYVCVPSYDSVSNEMEFAPCLSASGDPVPGQTSPTFATCPGTIKPTGISAGYQAEDVFGKGAYTIPIFSHTLQFAYQSNWSRVIDANGVGIPNYFTWLDAYSPNPVIPGTVRQGFQFFLNSLNPYRAGFFEEFYILHNIYDSLYQAHPLSPSQVIDWMTTGHSFVSNSSLGYTPPAGTITTIRNTLNPDIFWQDGQQVTAWDVAFSFNSLIANGAFQTEALSGRVSGITVLSKTQFDINLFAGDPFIELGVAGVTVLPGHLWSSCASTWSSFIASQTLPSVIPRGTGSCMNTTTTLVAFSFDPLASGILLGSGAWTCQSTGGTGLPPTGTLGGGCSSTNTQNAGTFTLTRNGCTITLAGTQCRKPGTGPGATANGNVMSTYFRSAGTFAQYIWSGITGNPATDLSMIGTVSTCSQNPGVAFTTSAACQRWQNGIGSTGALTGSYSGVSCGSINGGTNNACNVELSEVASVGNFYANYGDWVPPIIFPYTSTTLTGAASFPLTLYEGAFTLAPANPQPNPTNCGTGWTYSNTATTGYDC